MADLLRCTVLGEPQPAGSKSAFAVPVGKPLVATRGFRRGTVAVADRNGILRFGRVVVSDDNKKAKAWKKAIADVVLEIVGPDHELLDGPLEALFTFYKPRPPSHYRKGKRTSHLLTSRAPLAWTSRPDALKLARAAEDALTGVLWRDDALVITGRQTKLYDDQARAEIVVRPWVGADAVSAQQQQLLEAAA